MINFMEFVCTLWNLLTLPEGDYGALAFLIKDPSAAGTINCKLRDREDHSMFGWCCLTRIRTLVHTKMVTFESYWR